VLGALACLVGLGALVAVTVVILLDSLDRPWVKRAIQGLVRASAGIEIDYRAARIEWLSGGEIDGLVVHSPAQLRRFAPDLVRIGRVQAHWSLRSLLRGPGPVVGRLVVSDVTLTAVIDEQGRTSFDALALSGPSASPSPKVPLSRQASKFFGTAAPVGRVDVDRVTLAWVRTKRGEVSDRAQLHGISVTLTTRSTEPTARGWRAEVGLGSAAIPLDLVLSLERAGVQTGSARSKLWVTVDATSSAVTAALDLRMIEQTFASVASADSWVHAEATLRFDPAVGRTEITLDHAEMGDGAATNEASMEISDAGELIVRRAAGDIDLARLLRWLPAGLVPVTAERARLRYRIDSLVTEPVVHLAAGGSVAVDAELSNVAVRPPDGPLDFDAAQVSLRAQPADGGAIAGRGSVRITGARLGLGEAGLAADDVSADFDGLQGADGVVAGRVGLRFARLVRADTRSVALRDGHAELRVEGLHPATDGPLAARGDLALSCELASLDLRSPGTRTRVDGLTLRAHTRLDGHGPYAVDLDAPVSRIRVMGHDGNVIVDAAARIEAQAHDVQFDVAHPTASRGVVHAVAALGDMRASLDATKGTDAVDFAIDACAASLKAIRPLLPAALTDAAPWDRMTVAMRSSGHVEPLNGGTPAVRQTTEVDVDRPAFGIVTARSLSLTLRSQGTVLAHEGSVDLRALGLAVGHDRPSDERVTISATANRKGPSLQFQLATEGHATAQLSGALSFEPSRRALAYAIDGHLSGLAPLAPLAARVHGLDAFDLSQLEIGLSARGALLGVVGGVARDGAIAVEPSPSRTLAVEGTADIRVAHFRWAKGNSAIVTPALAWHGDMRASGTRRTLDSRTEVGTLHLDLGSRDVDLNGISEHTSVAVGGNLADPEIDLTELSTIRAVEQTVVPEYPVGDLTFALSAERGPEGVVHISDMNVSNGLGGTALGVRGNVDLGEGRRTLSVTASLTQDLERLSRIPERFKGRGKIAVETNITSPDLTHYQVRAAVKGEDVTVTLSRMGIDVETANGEVPITIALEVGENGVSLERNDKQSPYSMLRFADQHPLLSRSGFLSLARLKTPFVSIAPLVGNLEVEQNVISLRQFEMGVRGGTITGQCGIAWNGPKSTLELHVRASGVQSSHGEPFDGNIEVAISAADRTIDGRAVILRIGPRHLLDLLDLQDPLHVDPAMNRIRAALAFGYPDTLRLVFDHGFASARLELGGLARLIRIGELRGIPMGPIVDKMLAPVLSGPDRKEPP
jgi:translocation and assembly module TamB